MRTALLSAYAATYIDVTLAVRQGNFRSAVLGRHAIAPALDQLQLAAEQYLRLGVVPVGVPVLGARVTSLRLDETPMEAVVASCPGAPTLVARGTGKPVAFRALPSNPVTVDLQTFQGRWVVSFFKVDRSKTCSA
ncbi:MAG: hypothetical protein ACYDAQ_00610 [Mycobacteriales bacterium]